MSLFNNFFSPGVVTFVSDRTMDFSLRNGESWPTLRHEHYLKTQLGFSLPTTVGLQQVHGNKIVTALLSDIQKTSPREADGLVTNEPRLALAIRTADCLPIFMHDPKHHCIGLVHAGWKGSQQQIVAQAIQTLQTSFGADPQDLRVAIGPAIRGCCYEVGPEFRGHFPQDVVERKSSLFLDLISANKRQLMQQGVLADNIFDCEQCTCCQGKYFSYRREKEKAGRMISLIMLKE